MNGLQVTSDAFENGGIMPASCAQRGENQSPALRLDGVDPKAKTLAIIADDPDIPIPFAVFTHWVVYNIPADAADIPGGLPREGALATLGGAMQGKNGFARIGYVGPNPPFGTHVYRFHVYALDAALNLKPGATRRQVERAMQGHILQTGLLEGTYSHR